MDTKTRRTGVRPVLCDIHVMMPSSGVVVSSSSLIYCNSLDSHAKYDTECSLPVHSDPHYSALRTARGDLM